MGRDCGKRCGWRPWMTSAVVWLAEAVLLWQWLGEGHELCKYMFAGWAGLCAVWGVFSVGACLAVLGASLRFNEVRMTRKGFDGEMRGRPPYSIAFLIDTCIAATLFCYGCWILGCVGVFCMAMAAIVMVLMHVIPKRED